MFIYDIMNDVITKNIKYEQYIDFLSSPDPISGVYILQEWNRRWATIYVNYVRRLHGTWFTFFLRHSVIQLISSA